MEMWLGLYANGVELKVCRNSTMESLWIFMEVRDNMKIVWK